MFCGYFLQKALIVQALEQRHGTVKRPKREEGWESGPGSRGKSRKVN